VGGSAPFENLPATDNVERAFWGSDIVDRAFETMKLAILALLQEYDEAIRTGLRERHCDEILLEIARLAPNSDFSDLMFYGEIERTDEEVAEEAAIREAIFAIEGISGVHDRILSQVSLVLNGNGYGSRECHYARLKFEEISALKMKSIN
jgi:hypothetical protein